MRHILAIASKELRASFNSAVALLFLATFLTTALFAFFWVEKFFARNTADIRPLFEWLPILLIFLVAALTMRLWSDEQKTGTLEILLTLPVPIHRLVLGKFVAGLVLVTIALALTLGVPITVSSMGNLDWGPVWGGYLAALLLAAAYLSIGLCVSATTDNQIVALMLTAVLCALLYLPGTEGVANFFGVETGELLRLIGTGSRFESIARGVLDLRDLAYYASLVVLFLTLNVVLLKAKRWSSGPRWRSARTSTQLAVGLVALNALALNLWLQPVASARIDLTEGNTYRLSEPTEKLLRSLDEPLILRGYFSQRTHPLLAPLVPQVRDMLKEYAVMGGKRVQVVFVDPSTDEKLEEEVQQEYGIKTVPLQFADRHERSLVNSYFHVLVGYGDQYEVLDVNNLIDVNVVAMDDIEVRLKNLEYDITKSIRKVVYGFQSPDALFASLSGKVELTAYITPDALPEDYKQLPDVLAKVAKDLEAESGGKFVYTMTTPTTRDEQQALYRKYGLQPRMSLLTGQALYLDLVLGVGDRLGLIPVPEVISENTVREAVLTGLKRVAPGFTKVVGLVTPPAQQQQPHGFPGMPPQPPRPPQGFSEISERLRETYEVSPVTLDSGPVPDDIDVLVLAGPENLDDKARKAVDQYLMRGGAVIAMVGAYRLDLQSRDLTVTKVNSGLDDLLAAYGVKVGDHLVLDSNSAAFPIPVRRNVGGFQMETVERLPYPFFVRVTPAGMEDGGLITGALEPVIMHWASPLELTGPAIAKPDDKSKPALKVSKLVVTSAESWLQTGADVRPDFERFPQTGFGRPKDVKKEDTGPQLLAVALTGTFDSAVAPPEPETPDETAEKADEKADNAISAGPGSKDEDGKDGKLPERLMRRSTPDARVVVIGSSSFASDELLGLSQRAGAVEVASNLQLVVNAVDWAVEDTDLLAIRARSSRARALNVPEGERGSWELWNYLIALFALVGVVVVARMRRRAAVKMASQIFVPSAVQTRGRSKEASQ
jgi:ABC-2 type transport system permease protein